MVDVSVIQPKPDCHCFQLERVYIKFLFDKFEIHTIIYGLSGFVK